MPIKINLKILKKDKPEITHTYIHTYIHTHTHTEGMGSPPIPQQEKEAKNW